MKQINLNKAISCDKIYFFKNQLTLPHHYEILCYHSYFHNKRVCWSLGDFIDTKYNGLQ